jgi:hypothetical protein
MDRARTLAMMFIVCALGISGRVHAQTTATPDGWVVLGIDEYRALRERASPSPPRPEAPPVDATLTRVDYELRIDGDGVAGRATLTIDTLRDGWTRVEIPSGLVARDARVDGQAGAAGTRRSRGAADRARRARGGDARDLAAAGGVRGQRVDRAARVARLDHARHHRPAPHRHRSEGDRRVHRRAIRDGGRDPLDHLRA